MKFFKSENAPEFLEKLNDYLAKSWKSLGSVVCKVNQLDEKLYEVVFFPALREFHGGKNDGGKVYPGFYFNVGKFVRVFDRMPAPKVSYNCFRNDVVEHIMFEGRLSGNNLKVAILSKPPNHEAIEKIYACGPKKGTIEAIK